MKQVAGFWLPDSELHLIPFLEKSAQFYKGPTYQVDKFLACLPQIKRFGHAIDVGAHCGLWSRVMAKCFKKLDAFEPLPRHIECWRKNVLDVNATLHECALGNIGGDVAMLEEKDSTGDSRIDSKATARVRIKTLDSLALSEVDYIKLDCEGFEYFAIKGGEETIRRDRPCLIVEQKPGKAKAYGIADGAAVGLLKSWGAALRFKQSGDYCLSWD